MVIVDLKDTDHCQILSRTFFSTDEHSNILNFYRKLNVVCFCLQLLDCVSIPAALALSCILLKVHYKIVHIIGVSVCLMGVGCLVWADVEDGRSLSGGKDCA